MTWLYICMYCCCPLHAGPHWGSKEKFGLHEVSRRVPRTWEAIHAQQVSGCTLDHCMKFLVTWREYSYSDLLVQSRRTESPCLHYGKFPESASTPNERGYIYSLIAPQLLSYTVHMWQKLGMCNRSWGEPRNIAKSGSEMACIISGDRKRGTK